MSDPNAGHSRAASSSLREVMPSLRYVLERWTSTVFGVTNSCCAIALFVCPAAANTATRRSLGVRASGPKTPRVGLRPPAALSSSRARSASGRAPHTAASSAARRSGSRGVGRAAPASPRRAQRHQVLGVLEAGG